MSNLLEHAKTELELIGYKNMKWDDPNKWMYDNIVEIIKTFAEQGHSGGSASYMLGILEKLLRFKNLSPLRVEDFFEVDISPGVYQCKRNPSMFLSEDKTGYYSVDDADRKIIKFEETKNEKSS